MLDRCLLPSAVAYENYGGRGIKVCDEWRGSFQRFLDDMGQCPRGLTLDRIDSNGHYVKGNCRWASAYVQANNRRTNKIVVVDGEQMTVRQAASRYKIADWTLRRRLKSGVPIHEILRHESQ